jgi:DnaK suppressor protein
MAADLRQATAGFIEDDTSYSDAIDQAAADTDRALAMVMKNRDTDIIRQIDGALRRIEQGTYGDCERCDDAIGEARIKAFPFTTVCVECKTEMETEEHRFPGRA